MAIADAIETNGVLWLIHEDGHITRKIGNYTEEKAPELFSYPKRPEIKPEEMITHTLNGEVICQDTEDEKIAHWLSAYEDIEQKNSLYATRWNELRKQKLRKVVSSYRKQQIREFFSRVFKKENTR